MLRFPGGTKENPLIREEEIQQAEEPVAIEEAEEKVVQEEKPKRGRPRKKSKES
jgi:hypothetical protein